MGQPGSAWATRRIGVHRLEPDLDPDPILDPEAARRLVAAVWPPLPLARRGVVPGRIAIERLAPLAAAEPATIPAVDVFAASAGAGAP